MNEMNEMNRLEAELRSWRPRRPSARLEWNIPAEPATRCEPQGLFHWLVPAMACLFLAFMAFNLENGFRGMNPGARPVGLKSGNQAVVSYQPEVNRWPAVFEWTNLSGSASSNGSLLRGQAN